MNWPRKVFLESNALFRLGPRLENVDFAKLLERRDDLGFELVSWREFMRRREKEVGDCLTKIKQCRADLAKPINLSQKPSKLSFRNRSKSCSRFRRGLIFVIT